MIRVADLVVTYIHSLGTEYIFTVTGGGAMFLNDAVAVNQKIKYVCNQHEQASVMAADTYSRVSGKLGVAMVTSGPGATNTVTGVVNAWQDSIPLMVIAGQSKKLQTVYNSKIKGLRQFGFLEANVIPIIQSVTKYSAFVDDPNKILYHLEKAVFLARSGRPGPVWIEIPLDIQGAVIDEKKLVGFKPSEIKGKVKTKPTKSDISTVIKLLKTSRKPVIIAGGGIRLSGAVDDFKKLTSTLGVPVVTSTMGTDVIEDDNEFFVGKAGMRGDRAANIAIQNSDLLITIGTRLGITIIGYEYDKFAPGAKKIVVDIDKAEHQKETIKIDHIIVSDAKNFINSLYAAVKKSKFSFKDDWLDRCVELKNKYPVYLDQYFKPDGAVNMYFAVDRISRNLTGHDIIVTDAGYSYYIVRQVIRVKKGERVLIPGATGAMGFSLPASIGASIGSQQRRVICITGDGSLQMNIQELQTISHHKLPIKIFVISNKGYVSIRNTQQIYFGRLIGESKKTGLSIPDISKIAGLYGIKFYKAKNSTDLIKVIPKVLNAAGPVICEISSLQNQNIMPTVTSKRLPDGRMVSAAIDDMYPFLPEKEMNKIREDLS